MALEGSIKDFGVADILQLISQQQKTGILLVEQQDESAEIYFSNGEVTETRSSKQLSRLAEMLVKSSLVAPEALSHALEKQKETFEYLGQILLREGLITKDALEHIVLTQIYETFYDILQWRDGRYRFIPQNIKAETGLGPVPRLESILLDVLRMIDEWPDIKLTIRSFSMVFGTVPGQGQEGLDADELLVYNLIDGKKTVQEILAGSIIGKFSACKILVSLLEGGYIKLIAERSEKKPPEGKAPAQKIILFVSGVVLCGLIAGLFFLPASFPGSIVPFANPRYFKSSCIQKYLLHTKAQKLANAAELFHVATGSYPETVAQLVTAGIFTDKDLRGLDNSTIAYAKEGMFYTIRIKKKALSLFTSG